VKIAAVAALRFLHALFVFGRIFVSYLVQLGLEKVLGRLVESRWRAVHTRNARRLANGCIRLRGVFIKMGQILSIMGTFLPRAYMKELEKLQDEVPPHPYREVEVAIAEGLGRPPEEIFATFSKTAIAAASLGQVHRATSHDGDELAVKVLYPNIHSIVRVDLIVVRWAMKVYGWFVPVQQLHRVVEQLRDMLSRETNFVHEAECIERMAANFADDPDVLLPSVRKDLSCATVLSMSFMEGTKISRKEELAELGLDPEEVAAKLTRAFYKQLFVDGFFHADPHPGNFFAQAGPEGQPRIVILDLGAGTVVRQPLVDGLMDVLGGLMTRNDDLVVKGIETMGFMSEDGDRELLERTIRRYFEKLLNLDITDLSKIDPQMAASLRDSELKRKQLRDIMRSVQFPEGWFYVERAAVLMFALCAHLAPKLNTVKVGLPYVMRFLAAKQSRERAAKAEPTDGGAVAAPAAPATPAAETA